MNFHGVLYRNEENTKLIEEQPDFFTDLNLDQIINGITEKKKDYGLDSIYYTSLQNVNEIKYRQDIFRDLQNSSIMRIVKIFSEKMEKMYRYLSGIDRLYQYQKERWLMDSSEIYCEAVESFSRDLDAGGPNSEGISNFSRYVKEYMDSEKFIKLRDETKYIRAKLDAVKFIMTIKTGKIVVSEYKDEEDYSAVVRRSFEKFRDSETKIKPEKDQQSYGMNHVEASVLELVARIFPETFQGLSEYYERNRNFIDPTIQRFHKDIQFYLAYMDYISRLEESGLHFCIPEMSDKDKNVHCHEGFDIGLADKLTKEKMPVVTNDFELEGNERIFVVSGPNHGGKTTFARMFGQIHYLASLGLPVPGINARLFLFDGIFTHFERQENLENQRGKLEDDLVRIKSIMESSTSRSIIIINEMLSSTTLKDAVILGEKIVEKIRSLDCLCLYVTFLDELASIDGTVSMVSTIVPEKPEERTYKIVKQPADGLAYAMALARKYRVTYGDIKRRISP